MSTCYRAPSFVSASRFARRLRPEAAYVVPAVVVAAALALLRPSFMTLLILAMIVSFIWSYGVGRRDPDDWRPHVPIRVPVLFFAGWAVVGELGRHFLSLGALGILGGVMISGLGVVAGIHALRDRTDPAGVQ